MIVVGLTGSIAMGKTETARMFAAAGVPVFDSDDAVHELYSVGGAAVGAIASVAPQATRSGFVDRKELSSAIQQTPDLLSSIEQVVHPLVRKSQADFLSAAEAAGAPFVVLDIPLLFETKRSRDVDKIVVVSCPAEMQRSRALARPGMTEAKLAAIMSRQVPDSEKRESADFVIDTSLTLADTNRQVKTFVGQLLQQASGSSNV